MKNIIMMFLMMVSLMAHASSADYNVRDEVNNVTFRTMKPEYRPAAMLVDVKNESITNLKADLQKGAKLIVKKK